MSDSHDAPSSSNRQELRTLSDLQPDPLNANRGTERGRALLGRSLSTSGAGRSVVADRFGVVIAGNKVVEHAKTLALPIRVVATTGDALVVVQRTDLDLATDPRARALAIADNRVGELDLDWDPGVLEQLRADGLVVQTWWTDAEWTALGGAAIVADPREDETFEPEPTTICRGDLFRLGRHRVLCGDATEAAAVARLLGDTAPVLMVTDPPYGVDYDPTWRHRAFPDQRTAVGRVANDTVVAWPEAFRLFPGDVVYAWHAARATATVATTLEQVGFTLRAQIVWVKQHFALSRGDYHWQHEPCWYAVRRDATSHWQGDRTQSTVWQVPNLNVMGGTRTGEDAPTGHSTQKPVRLFEIPIRNHTTPADAVYDPFVGSGTTLIAAEKTGRTAFVMDLEPRYVQAAITRWERFTGQKADPIPSASRNEADDV
jgi:DNA modification methylase